MLALCTVLTPVMFWAATDTTKIKAEMERIEHLNAALNKGGIAELLETVSRESMAAPLINSKYFAESIAKKEPALAPLEKAKRAFGYKVAQALDGVATNVQKKASSDERVLQAEQLFNLVAWLKTEKGYGNYILIARCDCLSVVPLAYLIADLTFPLEKVAVLRSRIAPPSEECEYRRTVLNREAPKSFIDPLVGTDSDQDDQMEICWNKQLYVVAKWFESRNVNIINRKRSDLPDDMVFFFDGELFGTTTTVGTWDMDLHSLTLVYGTRDKNIEHIDYFFKYRQLVGKFPTTPPKWWKSGGKYTAIEAAFESAWLPFEGKNGPIFDTAALVYEQVTTGTFMDWESHDTLLEEQMKKSQEKRNREIIEEQNKKSKEPVNR